LVVPSFGEPSSGDELAGRAASTPGGREPRVFVATAPAIVAAIRGLCCVPAPVSPSRWNTLRALRVLDWWGAGAHYLNVH
jgi:hypothetical protein